MVASVGCVASVSLVARGADKDRCRRCTDVQNVFHPIAMARCQKKRVANVSPHSGDATSLDPTETRVDIPGVAQPSGR
jgi:hypothetical protein